MRRGTVRILIANPDQDFVRPIVNAFHQIGYYSDHASGPGDVSLMLKNGDYELLIADVNLIGRDEWRLIKKVSEKSMDLSVILIGDQNGLKKAKQGVHFQALAYLEIPVEVDRLVRLVEISMRQRRYPGAITECPEKITFVK